MIASLDFPLESGQVYQQVFGDTQLPLEYPGHGQAAEGAPRRMILLAVKPAVFCQAIREQFGRRLVAPKVAKNNSKVKLDQ
jgi:hypothetical protein